MDLRPAKRPFHFLSGFTSVLSHTINSEKFLSTFFLRAIAAGGYYGLAHKPETGRNWKR